MATELAIVRKVGEGVDKPNAEQELPIDINYLKLVDFLVRIQRFREWTAMRSLKASFSFFDDACMRRSLARSCPVTGISA